MTPIFPWFLTEGITPGPVTPQPRTLWVAFPELHTARCVRQGTRSALGALINLIHAETKAYTASH